METNLMAKMLNPMEQHFKENGVFIMLIIYEYLKRYKKLKNFLINLIKSHFIFLKITIIH